MKGKTVVFTVMVLFLLMGPVTSGHTAASDFIEQETISGIGIMTGGVGSEERKQMKALADPYNLKLEFAVTSGSYLSGVSFSLERLDGTEVLKKSETGPWVYLDLPTGSYVVRAWRDGERVSHPVEVTREKKTVILHWPQD